MLSSVQVNFFFCGPHLLQSQEIQAWHVLVGNVVCGNPTYRECVYHTLWYFFPRRRWTAMLNRTDLNGSSDWSVALPSDDNNTYYRPIIGWVKRAPHWAVQSRFRVIYIYVSMYVGLSTGNPYKNYICPNAWAGLHAPNTRMLKVSFGWLKPPYYSFLLYTRAALGWTKKKSKKPRSLRNE